MVAKLNQIIAIEKGIKSKSVSDVGELYKVVQKPDLFNGFSKTYQPKDEDDGEKLPAEKKRVQFNVPEVLRAVERSMTDLISVTSRKDWTNTVAKADVSVDGNVIFKDAPVSFLLFMEKQLTDLRTLVGHLPLLDEGENWTKDVNSGLYKSEVAQTHRTKKISKPIVLYPATPEHPAQTAMTTEDVISGFWSLVKQSGAMPKPDKQKLFERVDKLLRAVKEARETANVQDEVVIPPVGPAVFNYLLGEG